MLCDSVMDHVHGAAVHGTMLYEDGRNGSDLPEFHNITIENIVAHGGDYGIFCGAIVDRIVYGSSVLRIIIPDDRCNRSSYTDLGRSGGRMAVAGLYPVRCGRCTASVYRNSGTVSCQDISGSKEPSGIPVKGFQ